MVITTFTGTYEMRTHLLNFTGALLLVSSWSVGAQQSRQQALSTLILSQDKSVRVSAINETLQIPPGSVAISLRTSLIALVGRHNEIVKDALRRRSAVDAVEDPELIHAVAEFVAQLRDPRAIPVLAEAPAGGKEVQMALAEFGERAVPDLIRVAAAPDNHYEVVDHALQSLRRVVDAGITTLSVASRQALRGLASDRMARGQYFTTLWYAMDLAMASGDVELRRTVDSLASHASSLRARGITDNEVIARTQKRARDLIRAYPPQG